MKTDYLVVEVTPKIQHALDVTEHETSKEWDDYKSSWTETGILSATYVHQTTQRTRDEMDPEVDFDIAYSTCMFNKNPMTYEEVALSEGGIDHIKSQIQSHRKTVKTLNRRIKQKQELVRQYS